MAAPAAQANAEKKPPNPHDTLRYAMLDYMNSLVMSSTKLSDEEKEGLEVAVQCMGEAFGLKLDDEETKKRLSIKPLTLPKVFDMGLQVLSAAGVPQRAAAADNPPGERSLEEVRRQQQTAQDQAARQRAAGGSAAAAGAAAASSTTSSGGGDARLLEKFIATLKTRGFFEGLEEGTPAWEERLEKARQKFREKFDAAPGGSAAANPNLRDRVAGESKRMEQAEALKAEGNKHLTEKRYEEAAKCYSQAIVLWPSNAVYHSNRAAAFTHLQKFDAAIADCKKAIEIKPDFSKAYSRLGTAHFQAGRYKAAIDEGYRKALELEPSNEQYKQALTMAESKVREQGALHAMNDSGDFSNLMQDPNVMANMADIMMRDPGFAQMAAGGMFSGPPAGGGGAAFDAAAGGSAAGASAARARGDGGAATNAAAGGEAGGGLMALLDHPDLADLKGKPLAEKILSDMQQYGSMAALTHLSNPESAAIFHRMSSVAAAAGQWNS